MYLYVEGSLVSKGLIGTYSYNLDQSKIYSLPIITGFSYSSFSNGGTDIGESVRTVSCVGIPDKYYFNGYGYFYVYYYKLVPA